VLVLDASVAVELSLRRGGFDLLADETLIAPRLLWSEVPSAIHELRWRAVISAQLAQGGLEQFLGAPVAVRRSAELPRLAWGVADELGWAKTYDAEYVALARLLGCRLLTADVRLRRGAARAVTVIGLGEV
jgi:predicted nucleic acid-binding protein